MTNKNKDEENKCYVNKIILVISIISFLTILCYIALSNIPLKCEYAYRIEKIITNEYTFLNNYYSDEIMCEEGDIVADYYDILGYSNIYSIEVGKICLIKYTTKTCEPYLK